MPVPAGRLLTQELEDQLALLARLTDGLDRLDENTRVTVVLHHLGELDTDQVAEVLGEPRREVQRRLSEAALALGLVPLDPACHTAAAAIDVSPASVPRVLARARAGRRRQWWIAAVAVLAVAAAAAVAYAVTLPEPSAAPDALEVTPVENPVNVSWWVDGHAAPGARHGPGPAVEGLVDTGIGVAYANDEGVVTTVTEEGVRQRVGTQDPGTPLLAQPSLRLHLLVRARGRQGRGLRRDARPRDRGRRPRRRRPRRRVGPRTALPGPGRCRPDPGPRPGQHRSSTHASPLPRAGSGRCSSMSRRGPSCGWTPACSRWCSPSSTSRARCPARGQLSRDGNFVLTHSGDGHPAAYDARSGDPQGTWFSDGTWTPVAAAWTEADRVVWVVAVTTAGLRDVRARAVQGLGRLVDPGSSPCTQRVDVDSLPVLAGTQPGLAAAADPPGALNGVMASTHRFRQVDVFSLRPAARQPGRGRPRRRRPRRRGRCSCSRSGPTCPRRRSCCRPPPTGADYRLRIFTAGPRAAVRRATRRSAARTRGSRPGGDAAGRRRRPGVRRPGWSGIARGDRLAFEAPPLLRDGPVDDGGPRPRSPGPCGIEPRRRRRHQVGRQRPRLGRRAPRRRADDGARPRARLLGLRRVWTSASSAPRRTARADATSRSARSSRATASPRTR